jgi:hypothetical protein
MPDDIVDPIPPIDGDPALAADDVDDEAAAQAIDDGKGNKLVPLSALVNAKKALRVATKAIKELEPIAQRSKEVNDRLDRAQPIIDAIITNPKLRAEALRIAQGTRTTSDTVDQPSADEDPDAAAYAEDAGFYLADGQTPDLARSRRVLDRLDKRHGRQTDDRIRPLAGLTLTDKANQNLRDAAAMVDDDGTPLATWESIKEVADQLPPHLMANPQVKELVLNSAIGLDRRKKRTPKAAEEPLYLERQSGGGRREPTVSPEEKKQLDRLGITEKEYAASTKRLEAGVAQRRGIVLGS